MKATDLRIGNLYYYRVVDHSDQRKEWLEVSKIDYDDLRVIAIKDEMNQDYQPIPLTEEWLFKFEKIDWISKDIYGIFFWFNGEKKYIKFVHSLQNTYFCMEQKELI